MIDAKAIRAAFRLRQKPSFVGANGRADMLVKDALHFQPLSWEHASVADWRDHFDAIHGMNAAAFCYFLPSILTLSLNGLNAIGLVGDSLIALLDTSGDPDLWTTFFVERFSQLSSAELEALQGWVYAIADDVADAVTLQRMNDTLAMLRLLRG